MQVWAVEDASIQLIENGSVVQSLNLAADSGGTIQWNAGSGDHVYQLESDGLIIPFHYSNGVIDPKPLMPLSTEIIGTPSSRGKLFTNADIATVGFQRSDGQTGELIAVKGGVTQVSGTGRLFSGASITLSSDKGIGGNSYADANGGNNTPFLPVAFLVSKGATPYPCDFVKFFSTQECTINIFNQDGTPWLLPSITLNGESTCWEYRIVNISSPIYFESDTTFSWVWQEPATNDETIGVVYGD